MRNLFISTMVCFVLISCNKQNKELSKVESFVETLKEGNSDRIDLPYFSIDDISELLVYRTDQTVMSNFPRNPISSFAMEQTTVGMYVLWIIESIRLNEIEDPKFYFFASLNPMIRRIGIAELPNQDEILPDIATAYFEWWTSSLPREEKIQVNPLGNLDFAWG